MDVIDEKATMAVANARLAGIPRLPDLMESLQLPEVVLCHGQGRRAAEIDP